MHCCVCPAECAPLCVHCWVCTPVCALLNVHCWMCTTVCIVVCAPLYMHHCVMCAPVCTPLSVHPYVCIAECAPLCLQCCVCTPVCALLCCTALFDKRCTCTALDNSVSLHSWPAQTRSWPSPFLWCHIVGNRESAPLLHCLLSLGNMHLRLSGLGASFLLTAGKCSRNTTLDLASTYWRMLWFILQFKALTNKAAVNFCVAVRFQLI